MIGINGKWIGHPMTGTERYGTEVSKRVIRSLGSAATLFIPKSAPIPAWIGDCRVVRSRLDGNAFEQIALPWLARNHHLISVGGPAPLAKRNQTVTLFDASVFRFPDTFGKAFSMWYRFMYLVLARTAKSVVTISEFSAIEISDVTRTRRKHFTVALCGSDHYRDLAPRKPDLDIPEVFVVCVGTMALRKNLVPVSAALAEAGVNTVIVGASGKAKVFGKQRVHPAASDSLIFAGRLSDEEIAWLYEHAVALVFPSLYEGFGLPIVEAQTRRCPVVCSDEPIMHEVGGSSVLYFNSNSPSEAVARVAELRESVGLREKLIEAGVRNSARFSWDATTEIILGIARNR
ncbi:glycosyltransferase family 4 protein [Cryobacterium algoricola]|nr:glycosyltransferase family 1 protein [Cryobacterium algoricola]